jgi:hypothetical protein
MIGIKHSLNNIHHNHRNILNSTSHMTQYIASQYLFSLLLFVSYNKALFSSNIDSHTIATRQSQDLYLPQANLTVYQTGVYYAGIRMFNKLPTEIKSTCNHFKRFKVVLWRFFLLIHFILWMNI